MSVQSGKDTTKGFIPVMLMPFTHDGKIDYKGLTELTEFYIGAGAVGLFANCLSSEMYDLTPDERIKSTKHVVDVAEGRLPVVATGNFGRTIEKQAEFVRIIHDTGVEAVILVSGLLADQNDSSEVFLRNTHELMKLTGEIPLGFYECPVPYKRIIAASELAQIIDTNRIVYHKDTSLDIKQVKAKLEVARNFNFKLYDAYLGHAVASLRAGASGLSCIQGNFFPDIIVWLCDHVNNAEMSYEVDTVQQFFTKNMNVMHAVYPAVAKYFLQKRGLGISTFSRQDGQNITDTVRKKIDVLFYEYEELRETLSVK